MEASAVGIWKSFAWTASWAVWKLFLWRGQGESADWERRRSPGSGEGQEGWGGGRCKGSLVHPRTTGTWEGGHHPFFLAVGETCSKSTVSKSSKTILRLPFFLPYATYSSPSIHYGWRKCHRILLLISETRSCTLQSLMCGNYPQKRKFNFANSWPHKQTNKHWDSFEGAWSHYPVASQTKRGGARGLVAVNHAYIWSNKWYFVDMFINYTQITAPNTNLTIDFHDHRPLVCATLHTQM